MCVVCAKCTSRRGCNLLHPWQEKKKWAIFTTKQNLPSKRVPYFLFKDRHRLCLTPIRHLLPTCADSPVVHGGCGGNRAPCTHPSTPLPPSHCLPVLCSVSKGPFWGTRDPRGSTGGSPGCLRIAKSKRQEPQHDEDLVSLSAVNQSGYTKSNVVEEFGNKKKAIVAATETYFWIQLLWEIVFNPGEGCSNSSQQSKQLAPSLCFHLQCSYIQLLWFAEEFVIWFSVNLIQTQMPV